MDVSTRRGRWEKGNNTFRDNLRAPITTIYWFCIPFLKLRLCLSVSLWERALAVSVCETTKKPAPSLALPSSSLSPKTRSAVCWFFTLFRFPHSWTTSKNQCLLLLHCIKNLLPPETYTPPHQTPRVFISFRFWIYMKAVSRRQSKYPKE